MQIIAKPAAKIQKVSLKIDIMKPEASNDFNMHRKQQQAKPGFRTSQQMRQANGDPVLTDINLAMILRHLWRGLRKLFVALHYNVHRAVYKATGGLQIRFRLPWFKLGIAALAVFILTQKDIQFSINMKAPLADIFGSQTAEMGNAVSTTQQLSLVQPLSFSEKSRTSNKVASADELDVSVAKDYINRFRKVAVIEMRKFGIPASIKMAQGLLESMAGQSAAAVNHQNHFGPAFGKDHYDSAWENWRAHSMLIQREFKSLLNEGASYKTWAKGLEKQGYSNDPDYADKLIEVIERYQLYLLDEEE